MGEQIRNEQIRNWAGNIGFSTSRLLRPTEVAQVQEYVAGATRLRALGTGHSFNRVADTAGTLLTVADLDPALSLDDSGTVATVAGGVRYAELTRFLDARGVALPNLGSLPHISVAGACSTATHGSGVGNRCLADAVVGVDVVRADGELVSYAAGEDAFPGCVVALGALGVVTGMRLAVQPSYEVRQDVWLGGSFAAVAEDPEAVLGAGYSVSIFSRLRPGGAVDQIWVKSRTDSTEIDLAWTGARPADTPQHPIVGEDASACTPQLGVAGPWHTRLPHFRAEFRPSKGDEQQSEFFLDRADASRALRVLAGLELGPVLLVCEVRTIAADRMWLSPFHGRDTLALHFTWANDDARVAEAVRRVQDALADFDVRPHWGKVFSLPAAQVRAAYPELDRFRELAARHDPDRVFGNEFLKTYVYD